MMIDLSSGRIAYLVLSFGGIPGMGKESIDLPWDTIKIDTANKVIVLNVSKEVLENALVSRKITGVIPANTPG